MFRKLSSSLSRSSIFPISTGPIFKSGSYPKSSRLRSSSFKIADTQMSDSTENPNLTAIPSATKPELFRALEFHLGSSFSVDPITPPPNPLVIVISGVGKDAVINKLREIGTGSIGKKAMVESLKRFGVISSKRVAEVMEALDRGLFVPTESSAYADTPLPIGYNATISAPHMHATCLQLLEDKLQPGMRALDVGSGTGYLTGCFALMVGAEGRVVGVDHISELVDMSIKNIEKSVAGSLLKKGSLSLHVGDGRKGWREFAPYDAIHVGAAASEIPQALLDQLKPGGRMVIPVGTYFQELKVIDKSEDGSIKVYTETSVRYVPLTSREEQIGGF